MTQTEQLPPHLGGHEGVTHTDEGALRYLADNFGTGDLIDVGCGPGGQIRLALTLGFDAWGIDGDYTMAVGDLFDRIFIHDFERPMPIIRSIRPTAFAWSCEFLEHVHERYQPNYMAVFQKCAHVVVTAAPPGAFGHHHVNCRDGAYWIEVFARYGFRHDPEITAAIRRASTMKRDFLRRTGLYFRNTK